ncbi:MAG: LacI family DNA-binding transcriptional regulator [Thermovirgaceae bacterium]|nr:LacI family DNA-binding transcriptional regulator [Thermovirgaceae bacterium]
MRVTMSDVAAEAGVNKATVSRVLRGDPRISSATGERVWSTIKALGYRPDAIARGLSSRSSDTIGVFFRDLSAPWAGEFLAGFERVVSRHGSECMIRATGADPQQRRNAMFRFLSRRVDGFVWLDGLPEPDAEVPGITVGIPSPSGVSVLVDIEVAASLLQGLAGDRDIEIVQGERPFFPGIHSFLPVVKKKESGTVRVYDGNLPPDTETEHGDILVICTTRKCPVLSPDSWRLYWPAFELGTLSARVLLNTIRGRGARPETVRLLPVLSGPSRDQL